MPVKFTQKGIDRISGKNNFSGTMGAEQDCPGLRCEWEYDCGIAVESCYRQTGWEEVERRRWTTKGKYGLKRGYFKL